MPQEREDADAAGLRVYLLDMGQEKYGDCMVCRLGDKALLIDGGHMGDWRGRDGYPSIPDQLEGILGHGAPFAFSLLVVTHCHLDHIGCLPKLVADGTVTSEWALVADEGIGFGRGDGDAIPSSDDPRHRLAALLREEDHSHLSDAELEEFLADAATLETRYKEMLATLAGAGTRIVRFGRDDPAPVEQAFLEFGLKVLGPAREHLQICAEAIVRFSDQAADVLARTDTVDDRPVMASYRGMLREADTATAEAEDRPGKGAALNDSSMVLKLKAGTATALLAGDMQFAAPEVSGLSGHMTQLRQKVAEDGPYGFIKLTHHASYNGFDEALLEEWSGTKFYAHSGGIQDAGHPDPGVLRLLEAQTATLTWARTDRNGLITVSFPGTNVEFDPERGELNDPTPNSDVGGAEKEEAVEPETAAVPAGPRVRVERAERQTEISVRLGPDMMGVTVTFDASRAGAPARPKRADVRPAVRPGSLPLPPAQFQFAGGRKLPKLLFVTYRPRLENNIGSREAQAAIQAIRQAGFTAYEVRNPGRPFVEIRKALDASFAGVVILGGYDVLPAQRLDVLPPALRQQVGTTTGDADNFIVWSDEVYGDRDGDGVAEVPVSRIPDAKSPKLVLATLSAGSARTARTRFGVRNSARPFAANPYALLPGGAALLISAPTGPATVGSQNAKAHCVYFMLHGSDTDAMRFWGEQQGVIFEAVNLGNVPASMVGVVFTGCCWGALTVQTLASQAVYGQPLGIRTTGMSMALSYLHAGVLAFVGCTGTHYSPTVAPYDYFGGPMHAAFWKSCIQGAAPAQALFDAKIDYASGLPHGQTSVTAQAIEYKILKQFTCLGLGW